MSDHKDINKVSEIKVNIHESNQKEFPFQVRTIVPTELHQIQTRATQVWNCDEIGFYPNSKCHKVVCNYKFFQGKILQKVKNGERTTFWCNLIVFTIADGKCFMLHVVVHQAKEYSQDLHQNTSLEWTVHPTPSGYMDRDRWLKAMTNYPKYAEPPLLTIRYSSSMDMIFTSTNAP